MRDITMQGGIGVVVVEIVWRTGKVTQERRRAPSSPRPLFLSHTQRLVNGWLTGRLLAELLVLVESFSSTFTPWMNLESLMCSGLIYSGTNCAMLQLLHVIQRQREKQEVRQFDLHFFFHFSTFFSVPTADRHFPRAGKSRSWKTSHQRL